MQKKNIRTGDWVVVCDGRKAMILENTGDEKFPNLRMHKTFDHPDSATHELGRDKPGRMFESHGQRRSSVEQADLHDAAERAFLKSLVEFLQVSLETSPERAMIVVAPPRALGMMRPVYSPALRQSILREIDKDLIKQPIYEIEQALLQSG